MLLALIASGALAGGCAGERVPVDPVVRHVQRGELALARGRAQRAERAFLSALAADPDRIEARHGLARALAAQQRYDEALEAWGPAQRGGPPALPDAELCLLVEHAAEARLADSETEAARSRLERAARAGCRSSSLDALRARTLLAEAERARSARRVAEAARLFRAAAVADPGRAESWLAAAEMLLRAGQRSEALELLSEALVRHPEDRSLRALMVDALGNRLLKPSVQP